MGGPRSPFPQWWIRDAAAQVGATKVEMAEGTDPGGVARGGKAGWVAPVGLTAGEMGDAGTEGTVQAEGQGSGLAGHRHCASRGRLWAARGVGNFVIPWTVVDYLGHLLGN
jgi:hypothetical protein